MGQARETMDRVTAAVMSGDRDALGQLYAADAVAETPEGPRLQGGAAIADYLLTFKRAFPDASFESAVKHKPATPRSTRATSWAPTSEC